MTKIHAKTQDQVLVATILPKLACNGKKVVELHVEFDATWDDFPARQAIFTTSNDPTPYPAPLSSTGDCTVPAEVLADDGYLFITIQGVNSSTGAIKPTTHIKYKVLPGTPSLLISDPSGSVYNRLVEADAVLGARMNTFTALKDGSTTGDAELADIRVDYAGATHGTAGDAVRSQVQNLMSISQRAAARLLPSSALYGGELNLKLTDTEVHNGAYVTNTGIVTTSAAYCYGYVDIFDAKNVVVDTSAISDTTSINFADENKQFIISVHQWGEPSVYELTVPDGARYICISSKKVDAENVFIAFEPGALRNEIDQIKQEAAKTDEKARDLAPKTFITGGTRTPELTKEEMMEGKYFTNEGVQRTNSDFCCVFIDVFNANAVTVAMANMSDTAAINATDESKTFIKNVISWSGSGTYELNLPEGTRYICLSCKIADLTNIAVTIKDRSITADSADATISDAAYAYMRTSRARFIKGVHLDCGRKYFSVANIKKLLDEMYAAKLNTFEIYFSDHEGFRFGLDDMNVTVDDVTYDLSVALGDGRAPTDGSGKWLTQAEMDEIIAYAEAYDIEVIPAFDMPGHFGAIRDKFPDAKFCETTEHGRAFMVEILKKYASYFAGKGCRYYNICGDETSISTDIYEKFMRKALHEIVKLNMTPLFYNDSVCKDGYLSPYLNNGGIVLGWIQRNGQAAYKKIDRAGYRMINAFHNPYYWVLNNDEKADNLPETIRNSDIFAMADGSKMYNIVGAMYHIWCDLANLHGADAGDQIIAETAECIAAFGEAVNSAVSGDYLSSGADYNGSISIT